MTRPATALRGVLVLVIGAVVAATLLHAPAVAGKSTVGPASTAPISSVSLVCPNVSALQQGATTVSSWVGMGVPLPGPNGLPADGKATRGRVTSSTQKGAPGLPISVLQRRGSASFVQPTGQGGLVVAGRGNLAPGLAAEQLTRRDDGAYRGMEGVRCTPPGGEAWAVGGTTTVGAHTRVFLSNIDAQPAIADFELFGRGGPLDAPRGRGITVPPHSVVAVALENVAPAQRLLLVHVQVRSGRLAVAVERQLQYGRTAKGVDYLPLVDSPQTDSVVPGVFGGAGPRRLVLGNPGDADATASVRLLTADGGFVPKGQANISIPAGEVVDVDLTKALNGGFAAVQVTADTPLVAGAEVNSGPHVDGIADSAWSAATPALAGPAVVSSNLVAYHRSCYLYLSTTDRRGAVRIDPLHGVGGAGTRKKVVHIEPGHTVRVDLLDLAGGNTAVAVAVTPLPGSGPVYAARVFVEAGSRGPLFTVLPLRTGASTVQVPPAVDDIRVGY